MRFPHLLFSFLCTTLPPSLAVKSGSAIAELDGVLRPSRTVNIASPLDGLLETVLVDRGDVVQSGQLVAELDMAVEAATAELAHVRSTQLAVIKSAELRLERLEEKLANHQALFDDGILSAEDLRETRTEKELAVYALLESRELRTLAEHEYRRARSIVERGLIKSPVAGVVVERFRSPGEVAMRSSSEPILSIAQLDPLVVETFAPVSLLGRVRPGMEAEILIDGLDAETRVGKLVVVDKVVDAASGTFGMRVEIQNADYRLPAGLRCRIRILP